MGRFLATAGLAMIFASALAVIPPIASATDTGNVFSDALFWFNGACDANGNGSLDTGELRDVRQIGNATHLLNQSHPTGCLRGSIVVTNMPVVHPHASVTNNETCLYFTQPLNSGSGTTLAAESVILPDLFDVWYQSNFTAVVRFRWEGPCKEGANSVLLSLGYGDSEKLGGLLLRIDPNGNFHAYFANGGGTQTFSSNASVAIHTNVWADVAIAVESGRVRVYRIMEDYQMDTGMWYVWSGSLPTKVLNDTTSVGSRFAIGCDGGELPASPRDWVKAVFRGQIQQVAIWNRALSAHEVAEAFGCQTDKLRFGVPDGGSGEFVGAMREGAPAKPEDWRNFAATLSQESPSLTLSFSLGTHEAGLSQRVGILPTPFSAAGEVSLLVNGLRADAHRVRPGALAAFVIPAGLTVEGENTVELVWLGSGTLELDALSIGGSFQIGRADSSHGEFNKRNRYMKTYYAYGPQTWKRFNNGVATDTNYEDNTLVFPLTETSASGEHELEIPCVCSTAGTDPLEVQVSVNGVVKSVENVTTRNWASPDTISLLLADGDLSPGANTIELRNVHSGAGTAVVYDYVRLLALPPKNGPSLIMVK